MPKERLLPEMARELRSKEITDRPEAMFRASFADSLSENPRAYVEQSLGEEDATDAGR